MTGLSSTGYSPGGGGACRSGMWASVIGHVFGGGGDLGGGGVGSFSVGTTPAGGGGYPLSDGGVPDGGGGGERSSAPGVSVG